jgi:hypothetical protein
MRNRDHRYMDNYANKYSSRPSFSKMANQKQGEARRWDKRTVIAVCILIALLAFAIL